MSECRWGKGNRRERERGDIYLLVSIEKRMSTRTGVIGYVGVKVFFLSFVLSFGVPIPVSTLDVKADKNNNNVRV